MAIEKQFVKEGIKKADIEEFLAQEFARAGYSHCDIFRTPMSTRIVVYASRPGMVIGRGGKNIDSITEMIRQKFSIENPQLDVREVENPDLDAQIVARHIVSALERGLNYTKVANITLQRVMEAGAAGIFVRVSGKLGGNMSRTEKYSAGYLKHSGEPAETLVKRGYAVANLKPGIVGVQVKILPELPKELEILKKEVEREEKK